MTTHTLKTLRSYWRALANGTKTFEVRRNDRDFAVGDTLVLECWAPDPDQRLHELHPCHKDNPERHVYASESWATDTARLRFEVTYILHGGDHGIERGYCVLGLRPIAEEKTA